MIIGNKNENKPIINPCIENERKKQHTDVTSKSEMNLKAYNILEERYKNGLISLEEFNKKCNEIRNLSQK